MSDGERKETFQRILINLCSRLEDFRTQVDVPKMPVYELKGSILEDIQKVYEDENLLAKWGKETIDFQIIESIEDMQINFHSFMNSISSDQHISLYLGQLQQIANNDVIFVHSFIHRFFQDRDEFSFDEGKFNTLWNLYKNHIYSDTLECSILIPICNFYSFKKELKHNNITCRIVDLRKDEYFYYLLQTLGEQPLVSFMPVTLDLELNSKQGIFTSHLFEFKYLYSLEQKEEFKKERFKALFDNPIPIEGGFTFSKEKMDELKQFNNPCLDELVDATRQIEKYLEVALQLFKRGDARVFGLLRERTGLAIYLKRAMFSLEKKDFSKLNIPYTLTEKEFFEFMDFWDDFYSHVFDIEVYDDVIHNFYDSQNETYEIIFFEYYKILEILFASDYIKPGPKFNAFQRRTGKFFLEHNYPAIYTPILDSLRKVRRQKAHEAFVDQDKIDKIGSIMDNKKKLTNFDIYYELKEIIRKILYDFWYLLKKNDYSIKEVRNYLDS